jgi:hypothetical protein
MSDTKTLADYVAVPPVRGNFINECVTLVDGEVRGKRGLGGIAVRGAYATVKAIKRGLVPELVEALLDEWLHNIEHYHTDWKKGASASFTSYVTARSEDVADDLLKVTDERAARSKHKTAAKAYRKLRGGAQKHVAAAVPQLGELVERHMAS